MRCRLREDESGNAILEFIFVALIVMLPLIYLVGTVAAIQRGRLAVADAAREAGRAYATSDTRAEASRRVDVAVRLALHDQRLPNDATITFVAARAACGSTSIVPRLQPGEQFAVCVSRRADLPFVPSTLQGHGIMLQGRYVVHVDDFRSVPR